MRDAEKQALTPEEVVARKGDDALDRKESPCDEAGAGEEAPAAQHATTYTNGVRPTHTATPRT